jgi:hypothetical protein
MDARMQKHRMVRWIGRLFIVLSLVESCGAADLGWCPIGYKEIFWALGRSMGPYPTDKAALQAGVDAYQYQSDQKTTVVSCNGQGVCTVCFNWLPECRKDVKFWNGIDVYRYDETTEYSASSWPSLIAPCGCHVAFDPAVPYSWNPVTGKCGSPLTITLKGGTEVEPSNGSDKKTLPFIATVKDQSTGLPTTNPVEVRISLKVNPTSGGHDHGKSDRPRGGIAGVQTCASDDECWKNNTVNGEVVFNFNAPEASGTYTISATCDGCTNTATKPVNVKVDGLEPIPAVPLFYSLVEANGDVIGARTGWHTDNHNLTPTAAQKLMAIAALYRSPKFMIVVDKKTGRKDFPPVLHINDASLPLGGVYDICARPDACPNDGVIAWQKPHAEHRRGTVVDVRANGDVGSIPASKKEAFITLLQIQKMPYLQESKKTSNEHFHLRLMGNKE